MTEEAGQEDEVSELRVQRTASAPSWISVPAILTSLVLGLLSLAVVLAGLTIPMPGTLVVTDPRELFATYGSALGGPLGGLLVGILAGIGEPIEVRASILAHIAGGLWMGFAYKKLVYSRLGMPVMLLGWIGLVLSYYCALVIPGFVIGQAYLSSPAAAPASIGFLFSTYWTLLQGALTELVLTTLVTTIVMLALPRRYRRPLW